ncbi:MAG: glycoside hydrolase family 32 protein [Victivallales bacterium]|nr:glycoside hydrolase family 32 protein [Victivallales bacterium]
MLNQHLLLFISHNRGCQYYIGDYRGDVFQPTSHGRMTWLDRSYFAPEALIDGKGRQIVWTWLVDNPADDFKTYGWSGVYGLPRSLWLQADGTLGIAPIDELKRLRKNEKSWTDLRLTDGENKSLEGFTGDCCELELTMDSVSATNFALNVHVSADGREKTVISYDAETKELVFDASASSLEPFNGFKEHVDIERAPFALKENEPLSLRVFVDGPVVEVFANGRQAITRRVYPTMESAGVSISAKGGSVFCNASAWDMNGIHTGN